MVQRRSSSVDRPSSRIAASLFLVASLMALWGGQFPVDTQTGKLPTGMVRVPAGTFVMGTDASRIDTLMLRFNTKRREMFLAEVPAHRATVAAFEIDRTEVTNAAFISKKWPAMCGSLWKTLGGRITLRIQPTRKSGA
jgi:formylglycine-generating enzyme required for sulfatase activity